MRFGDFADEKKYYDDSLNDYIWFKHVPDKFIVNPDKWKMVDAVNYPELSNDLIYDMFGKIVPVFFIDISKPFYGYRDEESDELYIEPTKVDVYYVDPDDDYKLKKTKIDEKVLEELWLEYGIVYPANMQESIIKKVLEGVSIRDLLLGEVVDG